MAIRATIGMIYTDKQIAKMIDLKSQFKNELARLLNKQQEEAIPDLENEPNHKEVKKFIRFG